MSTSLLQRDHAHIWHPTSQMKDYETFPPLCIKYAEGPYLFTEDNHRVIDAISSWWCKSLGHQHPRLQKAVEEQMKKFEHVIFANTTYEKAVLLSEALAGLTGSLNKVFYACDGSSSVEIALKMSLQAQQLKGNHSRTEFMALQHDYHGETCATLSLSDVGHFRKYFEPLLNPVTFIKHVPYVSGRKDARWNDCSSIWPLVESQLNAKVETLCAIIVEPILQGASGMLIYSPDFLKRLRQWTEKNHVYLIADEIMTGFGRTGLPLACQHADIEPDFLCLAKNLTAGFLPLSATLTREDIYCLFYDDYAAGKAFWHAHTHTGNALAIAVALEALKIYEKEKIYQRAQEMEVILLTFMEEIAQTTGKLKNVRGLGAVVAADLVVENPTERAGYAVYQKAVELGALLRPIGNTLYWLPPLNCELNVLMELKDITLRAIQAVLR